MKKLILISSILGLVPALPTPSQAETITASGPFEFLDNRSANDAGIATGVILQFGVQHVTPSGANGTTGIATNPNNQNQRQLMPENFTTNPNFFTAGVRPTPNAAGTYSAPAWNFAFTNGSDGLNVFNTNNGLPPPNGIPKGISNLTPIPFVNNVTYAYSASGALPTVNWTNTQSSLDAIAIRIRDNGVNAGSGIADLVYTQYFAPTTTSVSLSTQPGLALTAGHEYSIEIDQLQTRGNQVFGQGFNTASQIFPATLNQSRSFFDFTYSPAASPTSVNAPLYLPTASLQPNGVPSYSFDIATKAGQTYFIDPAYASGYVFATGAGDPNFASVLLPELSGTPNYTIVLPDGRTFTVIGGQLFDFTQYFGDGVSTFTVKGITELTNLDPGDPLAFAAGLTFVRDGEFTGTMDPILAGVPEPSTWAMMLLGFCGLGYLARRRRNRSLALITA